MSGKKPTKRKRRAVEAASKRWSSPLPTPTRKNDFSCQVDFIFARPETKSSTTVATQTDEKLPGDVEFVKSTRVEVDEEEGSDAELIGPRQLQEFLCKFRVPISPENEEKNGKFLDEVDKCQGLEDGNEILETVRKVESFFSEKDFNIKDLTKNTLRVEQSPLVISSSEKFRQTVERKCTSCEQNGTLTFVKETEPQTGNLKLDYVCSECASVFSICTSNETIPTRTKPKMYLSNYIMLAFVVSGEYYKDYDHVLGTLGISHFSEKQWVRMIEWIAPHVEKIANWSVEQARKIIRERGDEDHLVVMYDGFYLTRGHYSNNCSATMHDAKTGNIIGFAHRTKRGQGANWQGTSGGAESNMLDEILVDVLEKEKMTIAKAVIDKDAACHEVLLSRSPETEIVYCGNHTAKSFHADLEKVKKTPCQVRERKATMH